MLLLKLAALLLGAANLANASDCDVALLDDPLDFQNLYNNRGGHRAEPFPQGTSNTCAYYASPDVVGDNHGACCTGTFVDNVVAPLMSSIVQTNKLSKECLNSLQRTSCFACARDQTRFLSIDFQKDNLPNSTAEIKVCRSTCHTVWEHCKDDAAFQIDGEHTVSEARLCAYLDDGITASLAEKGSRVVVSIVEDEAIQTPECFLYDDLKPVVTEFKPPALSLVKPSTTIFQIVFNERIKRKNLDTTITNGADSASSLGGNDATPSPAANGDNKSIQLLKMNEDGTTQIVVSIDATDPTSSSNIQIVTSAFVDDTLQIVFDDSTDSCLLDVHRESKYSIVVGAGILEDRSGNIYNGIDDKSWTFSSDPKAGCTAGAGGGMTAVGVGLTAGVLVLVLLGGVVCVVAQRRSSTTNPRQYADFGDDIMPDSTGPIQEGSTVTTADGAKLQVRLVPAYEHPEGGTADVDIGAVQEEKV
jgi:hypothetical protein